MWLRGTDLNLASLSNQSTPFSTSLFNEVILGEGEVGFDRGGVAGFVFLDGTGMPHNPMALRGPVIITLLFLIIFTL